MFLSSVIPFKWPMRVGLADLQPPILDFPHTSPAAPTLNYLSLTGDKPHVLWVQL